MEEQINDISSGRVMNEEKGKKVIHMSYFYRDKMLRPNRCIQALGSDNESDTKEEEDQMMSNMKELDKKYNVICLVINISKEEWKTLCEPWKLCLMVKFLGKTLEFRFLKAWLQKLWLREMGMEFINIGNECFLVKFLDQKDYNFALIKGPWVIAEHYLII